MPNSTLYAFILSFLAGISTVIGALVIFLDKGKNNKYIIVYNKNYQDNFCYYFGSLFNSYKCYLISSSIIFLILSMSVKNKFNPVFLLAIIYLKLSKISSFNTLTTFNGFPFNICG